ncbi:MAG TPA: bifunctional nicotinamide-nucleotide adenylyltransferase/Nudix hydroxylase, partial [Pyrinomonadaceae bacterium]|nr:bifunctional nicotinamide-nucleotide adenylyltransferase/Nudix hydroxylase [Pyrinomonadaceae bacterium]
MNNKYHFGIVIGRFQPFHLAHQKLIEHALSLAETVIIVLGSARSAPDVKNPFTPAMREEIVRACFPKDASRLIFRAVRDYPYNDHVWTAEIQNIVGEIIEESENEHAKTAIVGFFKDRSSYYLNLFPQWNFEEFYVADKRLLSIKATVIRESFFAGTDVWQKLVPETVQRYLEIFKKSEFFPPLESEFEYVRKYKQDTRFLGVPFAPIFVTTDAVVVQSGHVLVVRRRVHPGKGLLALPGGFLKEDATLEDSMLRELKEETQIKVPAQVLRGSIKTSHAFDHPERSTRGRTVTFAYHIELEASLKDGLPRVKGGDDAARAF